MASTTGSGGFVFRDERKTLDVRTSSPERVGPGSYSTNSSPLRGSYANPALAPFCSTLERNLGENTTTSAVTPGPGAYQAAAAFDAAQLRRALPQGNTSVFASTVARLPQSKTNVANPGPGSYPEGNAWIHKKHNFQAPAPKQRVNYVRVPSAPSIPTHGQSYGYEEGVNGQLIMQRPQDPILSGTGRDTAGPGHYDPKPGPERRNAVAWGASRTKRGLIVKSDVPGPGQYEAQSLKTAANGIVVSINGMDVQFGGASGSSQFASKVPINSQRPVRDWEKTPGPGAYHIDPGMGKTPLPMELQFFGSSARRGNQVDPMQSLHASTYFRNPGPGAYDSSATAGVRVSQQCLTDPQPFNQTSKRFGSDANGVPGPGEYKPDYQVNMHKEVVNKNAVSKGGVFGTTSQRWSGREAASAAKVPGPGNYDAKPEPARPSKKGNDTNFSSRTDRFRASTAPTAVDTSDYDPESGEPPRGDPSRLGPGAYSLPDTWSKKGSGRGFHKAAFGSESKRSSVVDTSRVGNPGPGRYNAAKDVGKAMRPFTVPAPDTVFGSQTSRFKSSGPYAPGPGHYNLAGDMARRSFNITYSGVSLAY